MSLTGQAALDAALVDLDRRMRLMEEQAEALAAANRFADAESTRRLVGRSRPDPVAGLQITPGAEGGSTFDLTWAPARISNLRYYEVQVSSSSDMANPSTIKTSHTRLTLEVGFGATRYARVRALSTNDAIGEWSATIDTTTGLVNFPSLEGGAATNFVKTIDDRSGEPGGGTLVLYSGAASGPGEETLTFGVTPFTTVGELVWPTSIVKVIEFTFSTVMYLRIDAVVDGAVFATSDNINFGSAFSGADIAVSGFVSPHIPAAGAHVYETRVTIGTTGVVGSTELRVRSVETTLYEFRR